MIILTDTFNGCTISRHRTVKAAVKADKAHNKAVKRANGQSSYIPTSITAEDGRDISEEIERERMALNGLNSPDSLPTVAPCSSHRK